MSKEQEARIQELEAELAEYRKAIDSAYCVNQVDTAALKLALCNLKAVSVALRIKLPPCFFETAYWRRAARNYLKAAERALDEHYLNGDGTQKPLGLIMP